MHFESHSHLGPPLCPSCQCKEEDTWHFLECNHHDHEQLFHKLKNKLTKLFQHLQLNLCIFMALWIGLAAICMDTPYPNITKEVLPQLVAPIQLQS